MESQTTLEAKLVYTISESDDGHPDNPESFCIVEDLEVWITPKVNIAPWLTEDQIEAIEKEILEMETVDDDWVRLCQEVI